jgi:hypothetical protein
MIFKNTYEKIFKNVYEIIYCKDDSYQKVFDNKDFYYLESINDNYYKGYLLHREDGPAIECSNGDKDWFLNGKWYTEKEYWKIINLKNKSKVINDI